MFRDIESVYDNSIKFNSVVIYVIRYGLTLSQIHSLEKEVNK